MYAKKRMTPTQAYLHENKNAFGESPFQKCIKESRNYREEAPASKIIITTYK
jgi:hypothetical protein